MAMYVDLDTILNNLTEEQKIELDWFYKPTKDFFIDDFSHILDLYPSTAGPGHWGLERFSDDRNKESNLTSK